jgi:GTPase Era involved in 16S rRNA processing
MCYLGATARPDQGLRQFINSVLGKEVALVSDGSFSCTRSVEQFVYKRKDGLTVTLVDTPGFSDYGEEDYKTDAEILQMIAQFLKTQ